MPHFAANLTMMFTEWPFLERFQAAADAGFKAVEFLFPYDHAPEKIAALLAQNHLKLALFNLPPGNWDAGARGLACLSGRATEFQASVETALLYAGICGAKTLHVMAGIADSQDKQAEARYCQSLQFACERAAKHNINLTIEPINARDMPGYFLNDFNMAAGLIARLGLPNLKLQYDIYHRQILHGDVLKSLEILLPIIGHIQVASVPFRHEPFSGELNEAHIFAALDKMGYRGFIGCEYRPAQGTLAGLRWMKTAGLA